MSAILVVRASTVTTAPGGADGYFTVADNSAFQYPGAIVAVTKSDGSLPRQCIIIDLSGTTKVGLQFFDGTRSPRYNKDDLSAYDTGSVLIMEAQVVSASSNEVSQLIAGANISLSPPDGVGTVTITGKDDPSLGYDTVQYPPGTALTQRTKLSFATADFTVADNSGSTRTDVTLKTTGPGAGTIGSAGITSITLDAQGRVTAATATALALQATTVSAGTGLSGGGDLSANRTISMPNTGPGAGAIGSSSSVVRSVTLDAQGRVTAATATNLGALATGLLKNTTTTGALSIAVANTDYAHPGATYIVQTATSAPGSAQVLASLATGLLKVTTTTGVLTTATAGSDYENPLTFGNGVTRTTNAVANDLTTGVSGGQTITGGTGSGDILKLRSTSHATKGSTYIGATAGTDFAVDEVNHRVGIGVAAPLAPLHVAGDTGAVRLGNGSGDVSCTVKTTFASATTWLSLFNTGAGNAIGLQNGLFVLNTSGQVVTTALSGSIATFIVTATTDTPATVWTTGVPSNNPSKYIKCTIGGTTLYVPGWT